MMPIKVQCGCGQRYSFEVEPVAGRMPSAVACPVCGADGTAAANQIITQNMTFAAPVAAVAAASALVAAPATSTSLRVSAPMLPPAPVAAAAPVPQTPVREWGPGGDGDTWKWWYYIIAGICIAGYDIWKTYDSGRLKYLNGLFLAVFCICIGVWDFQRKRKQSRGG